MALDSFDGLKAEIEDYLDHDDVAAKAGTFVRLAEAKFAREIRIREMIQRAQVSLDDRYLALPARFVQMRRLRLLSAETTGPRLVAAPEEVTIEELDGKARLDAGLPGYFTVHEEIEFDRAPEEAITAEMVYFAHFRPLGDDYPANGLLTAAPDIYLYGALAEAEPYLGEDERIALWRQLYAEGRDRLNQAFRNAQYGSGIASRVKGSTP